MKYSHIWRYVADTPWAITPEKLTEIVALLSARTAGVQATAEELAAFAGEPAPAPSSRGSIAVLSLRGCIAHRAGMLEESSGGVSTEAFGRVYRQVMQDPAITGVVIDVDSPGGAVAGLHELAQQMLALRGLKKVIAVANSTMASAAYWLAAAGADEIWGIPSCSVGSIGIASIYVDDSKAREMNGIEVEVFTSGANKVDVLGLGPLSEAARARRQARVDEAGAWFRADVAKGRGVSIPEVRSKYGEGIVFGGKDALAAGLIDKIGTLEDAIAKLSGRGASARSEVRAESELPALSAEAPAVAAVAVDVVVDADRLRSVERY